MSPRLEALPHWSQVRVSFASLSHRWLLNTSFRTASHRTVLLPSPLAEQVSHAVSNPFYGETRALLSTRQRVGTREGRAEAPRKFSESNSDFTKLWPNRFGHRAQGSFEVLDV